MLNAIVRAYGAVVIGDVAIRSCRARRVGVIAFVDPNRRALARSEQAPGEMASEPALRGGVSPEERATLELAAQLVASGNLHPLIARLRDGEVGPESVRGALRALGELDLDLLVQITLDGLITIYLEDPGLAHQPRREVRGEGSVLG